jgi:tetratricopeptide (TPR) repeat protein
LEVYKEVDSPLLDSLRLDVLSMISGEKGDVEAGERYCREGITAFRKLGYHHEDCTSLAVLSDALVYSGKLAEARIWAQESLRLALELSAGSFAISLASLGLSYVLLQIGDYTQARTFALKSLHEADKINSNRKIMALECLVRIDLAENRAEAALERFPEIYETLQGYHPEMTYQIRHLPSLAYTHLALKQTEQAEEYLLQCFQAAIRTGSFRFALHSLPVLALLEAAQGKPERAIEVYEVALQHLFVARSKWFEEVVGKQIASLAATLPAAEAARQRGRSLEMWEVIRGWLEESSSHRQALI